MQFIKTHMISLICGVLGLVFIVGAVLGMMQDDVLKEMQARAAVANEINSLRSNAKNSDVIDAEKKRGASFKVEFDKTIAALKEINKRTPLKEGVFPTTPNPTAAFEFKQDYALAMKQLPAEMLAGELPSPAEVAEEERTVATILEHMKEMEEGGGAAAKPISERAAGPVISGPTGSPRQQGGGMISPAGGGPRSAGALGVAAPGGTSESQFSLTGGNTDPKLNPAYRAAVNKAKNIRLYALPSAFHLSPIATSIEEPSEAAMWYAQMGLWIQQDIARAIARTNESARSEVSGELSVEHTPVKRLVRTRVLGYVAQGKLIAFPAAEGTLTAGGSAANDEVNRKSFTGAVSNEDFDVVRFTVVVIVDQRDILRLLDEMCKANFYKCIHLSYTQVPSAADGFFYGADPIVQVTMDFEGYFARSIYAQWMPKKVREELGIQTQ